MARQRHAKLKPLAKVLKLKPRRAPADRSSTPDTTQSSVLHQRAFQGPPFLKRVWENLHNPGGSHHSTALEDDVRQKLQDGVSPKEIRTLLKECACL